ncbi:Glyoxalase-like domain protein [Pseudovibrio axinellae]|uniref:Glyoxalase-like domain protein n=1 Tax=Pseudovibrio axinellae TaxID=989403 RepID=A0A166B1J2_9HYPH|nr:Glyoxalase-like domain protein [Pseudovibrio axinellae]SEQ79513.1 Catechol 2,3-dioxygenase [Pseudovibrio axinellae]
MVCDSWIAWEGELLHHVEIYVSDIERSHAFWKPLFSLAGYKESGRWGDGFTFESSKGAYLTFVQVAEKYAIHPYHRCGVGLNHLAFSVVDRARVDRIRTHCLELDIPLLYEDRYPFANGGTDYYAVFLEDPDRIKIEFVARSSDR